MRLFNTCCFILWSLLVSCGSDDASTKSSDSIPRIIVAKDSAAVNDSIPATAIAFSLGGDTIVTGNANDIFFSFTKSMENNKCKLLSVKEVRKRFLPIDPNCDGEANYQLKRFFELDSLRKADEDIDHDMGQTINVEIRVVDTIKKNKDDCWVAWTIYYTTAQQCPFAEGTFFMLTTYDKAGKLISTQCMGCIAGGGDAPISWTKTHTSNIFQDGSFRGLYADSTEDYDEAKGKPVYSIYRNVYTGQIAPNGKITVNQKEIERMD
jgi:hypothetical protein